MAGFTSGKGCFLVKISKSKDSKLENVVGLGFNLTQHKRDRELIKSFVYFFFKCGNIYFNRDAVILRVNKFSDINEKILPFFKEHKILEVKSRDFDDWCKVASLMKEKKNI